MTTLGVRKVRPGAPRVSSVGTFVEVDRLDWNEFGKAGDTHYAFLVFGRVGENTPSLVPPTDAQVEVGLGVPGKIQPSPVHVARPFDVAYATFQQNRRGLPFHFLIVIDGNANDFGVPSITAWTPGDDLAIYARTRPNGDVGIANTFTVSDLTYIAINLDELDRAGVLWGYGESAAGTVLSSATQQLVAAPSIFPDVSNAVEYMVWAHVNYTCNEIGSNVPRFQAGEVVGAVPAPAGFNSRVGLGGSGRWGIAAPRTTAGAVATCQQFQMCYGVFVPTQDATTKGAIQAKDTVGMTVQTVVNSARMFAIESRALAFWQSRRFGRYPDPATIPPFPNGITSNFGNQSWFIPWEINVPRGADFTTIHQGFVEHKGGAGVVRSFTPTADTDTTQRTLRAARLFDTVLYPSWGVPSFVIVPELIVGPPGQPAESRYEFHWWDVNGGGAEHWDLTDVVTAGFYLNDDPDNAVDPPQPPTPPVILVPPKEAVALGSLVELPVKPDSQTQHSVEVPLEVFLTDTGYKRTWPRQAEVRRVENWTWTGLKTAERDAVHQHFLDNPTFKYTDPRDNVTRAFAILGRIEWTDVGGGLHASSLQVAELGNIG